MNRYLFLLFSLFSLPKAFSQETTIRMIVNEETQECRRMIPMTCLLVQRDGSQEWTLFYDRIKGFEHEQGYRYEIIVVQTRRPEPIPQDLSEYLYRLEKVVSKTWMYPEKSGNSDNTWKVGSLNGVQLNTDDIYFSFNEDSTAISGKSGCNQFSVPVSFNKKRTKIKTKGITSTLMMCSEEQMQREQAFTSALSNAKFKLSKDGEQWLWKKGRKVVLIAEPHTLPLEPSAQRTPWDFFDGKTLKVIQLNGESVGLENAHLVFDKKAGRFSGNNGCNQTGGSFSSENGTIRFSEVYSTKMACMDEEVQKVEKGINVVFAEKNLTIDFAEHVMNIYGPDGKLVLMLAAEKR